MNIYLFDSKTVVIEYSKKISSCNKTIKGREINIILTINGIHRKLSESIRSYQREP